VDADILKDAKDVLKESDKKEDIIV